VQQVMGAVKMTDLTTLELVALLEGHLDARRMTGGLSLTPSKKLSGPVLRLVNETVDFGDAAPEPAKQSRGSARPAHWWRSRPGVNAAGKRCDQEHDKVIEAARPWDWYRRKCGSPFKGEKK
jgi:hypothetical protein